MQANIKRFNLIILSKCVPRAYHGREEMIFYANISPVWVASAPALPTVPTMSAAAPMSTVPAMPSGASPSPKTAISARKAKVEPVLFLRSCLTAGPLFSKGLTEYSQTA